MSVTLDSRLRNRWLSGRHVGAARPTQVLQVRRGYMRRHRDTDGHWTATWTPTEDYKTLTGVSSVNMETSFDSNGIRTLTVDLANTIYPEFVGPLGAYHRIEVGGMSPYRTFQPPRRPKRKATKNEWDGRLADVFEVLVMQGYGDQRPVTFTGLVDVVGGGAKPATMRLTARDFGLLLTDVHPFGWNIDPHLRDPLTFDDRQRVRALLRSSDPSKRREGHERSKNSHLTDDLSDVVTTICRWAGFPKASLRIEKTGVRLKDPIAFGRGEFMIDVVRKVQDVTGFTFFIGTPSAAHPLGRPTFRRTHAVTVPPPVEEVRDTQLLTGFSWQRTTEPLAGIIRVRGKDSRAGMTLGGDTLRRLMSVYRPPWHVHERDARLIKHVVHTEPLYTTQQQVEVAARMIALQESLAAWTGNVEIPGHPGLELDDLIGLVDTATGINSRMLAAHLSSTFTEGKTTSYKQTVGVTLLDNPDTIAVLADLNHALTHKPAPIRTLGGGIVAP